MITIVYICVSIISAVESTTMGHLIDYIYTGNLDISQSNVWSLIGAASLLEMNQVTTMCQNYLISGVQSEDPIPEVKVQAIIKGGNVTADNTSATTGASNPGTTDMKQLNKGEVQAGKGKVDEADSQRYLVFNTSKKQPATNDAIKGETLTEEEGPEAFEFLPETELDNSKTRRKSRKRKSNNEIRGGKKTKKKMENKDESKKKTSKKNKKESGRKIKQKPIEVNSLSEEEESQVCPSWYTVGPSWYSVGPSWYKWVQAGIQWVPAGIQWVPAGIQWVPAGIQWVPAGIQWVPAGIQWVPAGIQWVPAGIQWVPAGIQWVPAGIQWVPAGIQWVPAGIQWRPSITDHPYLPHVNTQWSVEYYSYFEISDKCHHVECGNVAIVVPFVYHCDKIKIFSISIIVQYDCTWLCFKQYKLIHNHCFTQTKISKYLYLTC